MIATHDLITSELREFVTVNTLSKCVRRNLETGFDRAGLEQLFQACDVVMEHALLVALRCHDAEIGGFVESEKSAGNDFPRGQRDFNRVTTPVQVERTDSSLKTVSKHGPVGVFKPIKDTDRKRVQGWNRA